MIKQWKKLIIVIFVASFLSSVLFEIVLEEKISRSEDVLSIRKTISQQIVNIIGPPRDISKTSHFSGNPPESIIENDTSEVIISNSSNIIIHNISTSLLVIYNSTNITIINGIFHGNSRLAMRIANSHNITIQDSFVSGAISINMSSKVTILCSKIFTTYQNYSSVNSVEIINSSDIIVFSNNISNLYGTSVYIYGSHRIFLLRNNIYDSTYAVDICYSENVCICNNTFNTPPETHSECLIFSYSSSNVMVNWNNILGRTSSTIILSKSGVVEVAYNNIICAFEAINVLRSSIVFIHDNIIGGWYQIGIGGSTLVWVLGNSFKEERGLIFEPFVEIRYSELILVEKNTIKEASTDIHFKVENSRKVFIFRNRGLIRSVVRVDDSHEVYILGKFLGIINVDYVLLWWLLINGLLSYPLLMIYVVKKN